LVARVSSPAALLALGLMGVRGTGLRRRETPRAGGPGRPAERPIAARGIIGLTVSAADGFPHN